MVELLMESIKLWNKATYLKSETHIKSGNLPYLLPKLDLDRPPKLWEISATKLLSEKKQVEKIS